MTDGQLLPHPTDADTRPAKRARSEEVVTDVSSTQQDTDFWFRDGSIILISSEGTVFRVHQTVLARNCEFFADMFNLAKPANEDLQELRLMDSTHDIKCFMHYLYDIGYFQPNNPATCRYIAALLRMATKYLCHILRKSILFYIARIYPSGYGALPTMRYISEGDGASDPTSLTINMLRENNAPELLPVVFYHACYAQSPNHASFLTSKLSAEDEHRLNTGRSHLVRAVVDIAWSHLRSAKFLGYDFCNDEDCVANRCEIVGKHFSEVYLAHRAFRRPMPHELCKVPKKNVSVKAGEVCLKCWRDWSENEGPAYRRVWELLHVYFDLPPPAVAVPPPST